MIAVSETVWQLVVGAPLAFAFGVGVGFLLANKYRLVRRRGSKPDE